MTRLAPPVPGARICSYQYEVRERETGTATHLGVDLCADCGTHILAPLPGLVHDLYWTSLGGNTLIIQHGPRLFTRYAHLMTYLVAKGQHVVLNQPIAVVGNTGTSASGRTYGCHLHFAATNIWYEPNSRIYREEDHYNLRVLLDSIGIVEEDRRLVWKDGWPKPSGGSIATPLLVGAGLFALYLLLVKLTGSKTLGLAAALPLIPP